MFTNRIKKRDSITKLFTFVIFLSFVLLLYQLIIPYTRFEFKKGIFIPVRYRLNETDIILEVGEHFTLHMAGINQKITYSTTKFKVADVNILGRITAKKPGTAVIKAKTKHYVSKCRVRVVKLNYQSLRLKVGSSKKLKVRGFNTNVKWETSNNKTASVKDGNIKAKNKGSVMIYAIIKGKKLSCNVHVY